jgi:hypothetical protein
MHRTEAVHPYRGFVLQDVVFLRDGHSAPIMPEWMLCNA